MGDVLALGVTHYPPLCGTDENMAWILKKMLQNPSLPEQFRTPAGWPAGMREEWGDDEGRAAAARHRAEMVGWLRRIRAELDAFRPDYVLMWGDDQYENFQEDLIPAYSISAHADFAFNPPPNNAWGESPEKTFRIAGAPKAAKQLASSLIQSGFETAYSYKPLHHPLGHAFSNGLMFLDYDRKGFPYPFVPFAINCYGRHVIAQHGGLPDFSRVLSEDELDPPGPTPQRLFEMGAATARFIKDSPYRVAIIASSGWSHAFLMAKTHGLWPDREADRQCFEWLRVGDYKALANYPTAQMEESGQQEILNWVCLAGALQELGRKPREIGLVDTWIFNSSKCFLIA